MAGWPRVRVRTCSIILVSTLLPGCFRFDYATVHVADRGMVALERAEPGGPRTLIAAGGVAGSTIVDPAVLPPFGVDTTARREVDGAIVVERNSYRDAFSSAILDGHGNATVFARALPKTRSDTFWVPVQHPYLPDLALATPWSNVERVTIKREPLRILGYFELGMGTIAALGGGAFIASSFGASKPEARNVELGVGVGFAAIGALLLGVGTWTLTTPTEEWTWTAP